jgi:hypothetical protein
VKILMTALLGLGLVGLELQNGQSMQGQTTVATYLPWLGLRSGWRRGSCSEVTLLTGLFFEGFGPFLFLSANTAVFVCAHMHLG